jgi:hypothetical protein
MNTYSTPFIRLLTLMAIAGNSFFILWILYNGLAENFQGTTVEKISYVTLLLLLAVNSILQIRNMRRQAMAHR